MEKLAVPERAKNHKQKSAHRADELTDLRCFLVLAHAATPACAAAICFSLAWRLPPIEICFLRALSRGTGLPPLRLAGSFRQILLHAQSCPPPARFQANTAKS